MLEKSSQTLGPLSSATVSSLLADAKLETGLNDYGDLGFTKGLSILLSAFQQEAGLNETGEKINYDTIIRHLVNRLRYQRDLKNHPEIRDEEITAPLIILGLPRTGTSKLQRILSADPQAQRLEYWRTVFPAPLPNEAPGNPAARITMAKEQEAMLATAFPDFMARHPMEAQEPDEELHLMDMSFDSFLPWVFADMPSYYQHMNSCDAQPMYRELYAMLQYLQWQDGGAKGRWWVLKSPVHLSHLPLLMETFPNANIIHCHRAPVDVIPSFASLIAEGRKIGSKQVDEKQVGKDQLRYWSEQISRYLRAREAVDDSRILDVNYNDIVNDVFAVISRIYNRTGKAASAAAMQAFQNYETNRPKGHWGRYSYTLEQYGLTAEDINKETAAYQRRFF